MKKITALCSLLLLTSLLFTATVFAQNAAGNLSAKKIYDEAVKKENVREAISYIKNNVSKTESSADKRSILYFQATLEEQSGLYEEAGKSYAQAASIAAGDAEGMKKVSTEQIVIDAVRCCLCSGNFENADSYLNSAVRSSKDEKIIAYVNLYSQWSALCKAEKLEDAKDSIALLKAYSTMDSMKSVKSSVLFTLWYVTGEKQYSESLQKEFPASLETAVVAGKAQIMSVPFWYFMPHSSTFGNNEVTVVQAEPSKLKSFSEADNSSDRTVSGQKKSSSENEKQSAKEESSEGKITRQQCGLFGKEENAKNLVARLKEKGFTASITTEKRASGNTYYIVVVDENKEGTMGLKLRDAGFECYPVVE